MGRFPHYEVCGSEAEQARCHVEKSLKTAVDRYGPGQMEPYVPSVAHRVPRAFPIEAKLRPTAVSTFEACELLELSHDWM